MENTQQEKPLEILEPTVDIWPGENSLVPESNNLQELLYGPTEDTMVDKIITPGENGQFSIKIIFSTANAAWGYFNNRFLPLVPEEQRPLSDQMSFVVEDDVCTVDVYCSTLLTKSGNSLTFIITNK